MATAYAAGSTGCICHCCLNPSSQTGYLLLHLVHSKPRKRTSSRGQTSNLSIEYSQTCFQGTQILEKLVIRKLFLIFHVFNIFFNVYHKEINF